MKKFLAVLLTGFTALTLFGCQAKPDTQALNTELKTTISNKQYAKAEGINAAIKSLNNTAASKKHATVLHAIVSAQAAFDAGKFTTAKQLTQGISSDNQQLNKAVQQLNTKASALAKDVGTIKSELKHARSLHNAGSDLEATTLLKKIIGTKTIKQPELKSQYIQALKLLNALNNTNVSDTTTTTATNNASASSASSSSATATSDSNSAAPEGQPVTGSETITDAEITQARADIKALGEDPTYFSNNDIRRAILKARADGRTHIKASDWQ